LSKFWHAKELSNKLVNTFASISGRCEQDFGQHKTAKSIWSKPPILPDAAA
jgi:hypothetical protein